MDMRHNNKKWILFMVRCLFLHTHTHTHNTAPKEMFIRNRLQP